MDLDQDACYRAVATRDARFDGRFFGGVTTTGIYCRPVCPAKTPKRENMVFYPTAAAAEEAGLRPCLRCRPETAPDVGAWRGSSNTVNRALALIELGAMDSGDNGGDVAALAGRLGVGERQLRRLFRQHLGASPVSVAQTRRVHLAKQLLHETRLPMAEVAMASGFGSIRRFNETFQTLFARPPGALRRDAGQDVAAGPQGEVTIRLRYRPPYDWDAMLAFLAARAVPGMELVEDDAYARVIEMDGEVGSVRVARGEDNTLVAAVRFPRLSALPAIIARLRRVFDLTADPQAINAHLAKDAALAPLVAARPGLRAPGGWDGFELAMRAVLGQQVTVGAAIRLAGRLVEAYGQPASPSATGDPRLNHAFPPPERIAAADLSYLGMPGARARALSTVAAAVVADPQLLGLNRSLEEAVARLKSLPGVGEWTAQYIALRGMREPDAFPAADVGLMRALAGPDGARPNAAELLARAEAWRPWRAYAAQHLWAATPTVHEAGQAACGRSST
ncbi:MAG: helix-turn-helix protein [Caulobacteraceae bacterium]|nr:helix-turn-helix protein [Caulobacteraceae bacterium]